MTPDVWRQAIQEMNDGNWNIKVGSLPFDYWQLDTALMLSSLRERKYNMIIDMPSSYHGKNEGKKGYLIFLNVSLQWFILC